MTATPPSDWLDQGQNAVWFFGVAFIGFMVWIFGKPIQHTKPTRKNQGRKRTGRGSQMVQPPKKQVARKHRTTKKRKKQKSKPRYAAQPLSREQEVLDARYVAKRDGVKFDNSWRSFGIPL